jgi:hypothetical protein
MTNNLLKSKNLDNLLIYQYSDDIYYFMVYNLKELFYSSIDRFFDINLLIIYQILL